MIFGRPIKDIIPILPGSYSPYNTWIETSRAREEAMRARNVRNAKSLIEHTVRLQLLKVGDPVVIQNQIGNHPLRWDRTCWIVEVKQFNSTSMPSEWMARAEFLSGIGNSNGSSTRSLWSAYLVLLSPSSFWKLPTTPRLYIRRINEPTQESRQKIHLQQGRKHCNRQVLTGAQYIQRSPETTAVTIKTPVKRNCPPNESLEMRTSISWTQITWPTPFLLDHPTRSSIVKINSMKPVHLTRSHH